MSTVEQWDEFAQDLAEQQEIQRQNLNNILNDPSASQATKDKAVNDFIQQEYYNDWIQEQNDQIQITGIIPLSLTIPTKTIHGALWIDASDNNKIKSGTVESFTNGQAFDSNRVHIADLDGTSIDLWVDNTSANPHTRIQSYRWSSGTGYYQGYFICYDLNNDGNITWHFGSSNSHYDSPNYYSGSKNGYACWWQVGANTPPIHNGFANMARWSATTSPNYGEYLLSNIQDYVFTGGQVDPEAPWDFYNNEVLPNVDPSNAFFPDGYEPDPDTSDPDDDEPIETPVITGDDMELQTDRTLTAPSDFITMYMITPPILSQFGRTLWTSLANYNPQDPTSADIFKNFYAVLNEQVTGSLDIGSIMNFIISVRQFPFAVSDITNIYELVGNTISFGTGALPIDCGSAAQVYRLTSTIGVLDLGEVTIADYSDFKLYNDFRDYYNTSVSAYLPYCGTVELNPIEAINSTIHCYYAIDFYTGECTAFLTTTSEDGHTIVSGSKSGTIGVLIPITATNSGQVAARHLSDNAKDSMLITSASGNLFGIVGGIASGNIMGAVSNATGLAQIGAQQKMLDAERQGRSAVMAPSLSGGVGAAAFVSPATASILVRRGTYARQKIVNYPQTCGYPATSSGQLKTYRGYTECYNVNVDSINCTEEEKAAIKLALESGVYLPTDV